MSGEKCEVWEPPQEVWSSTTISKSIMLSITSASAMFDALNQIGCKVKTDLPASKAVLKIQMEYQETLKELSQIQPNSHDASIKYEETINRSIKASEALKIAKELATKEAPNEINFTDKNGINRTMTKMSGAYMLRWSETEETGNQGGHVYHRDDGTRQFNNELKIANDKCQIARKENEANAMVDIKQRSKDLFSQLEKALRIRTQWEAIEEARRLKSFRQERASELEKNMDELGYDYKRLVDTEDEIVLVGRK